jgi:superfamily I DNA/RNA helicase
VNRLSKFISSHYTEDDILIITSKKEVTKMKKLLDNRNIPSWIGEPDQDGYVAIVDFQNAKGLEREIVLVTGIEDLYNRTKKLGLFKDEDKKIKKEILSRRMVYVAMTRTIEQLIIYYQDPGNRFISDLIRLNSQILSKIADS